MSRSTSSAKWRTVTRDGVTGLKSPSGETYHGTPREIRDAALMPWWRDMLAQSLRLAHALRLRGTYTAEELREVCATYRREAVVHGAADIQRGACVTVPADKFILLCAGARLVGLAEAAFFREVWNAQITGLLDFAESETGKREIPLTRHERRALDRLGASPSSKTTSSTTEKVKGN